MLALAAWAAGTSFFQSPRTIAPSWCGLLADCTLSASTGSRWPSGRARSRYASDVTVVPAGPSIGPFAREVAS